MSNKIREAMAPDSVLLINETILPECNVAMSSAQANLTMMVCFGIVGADWWVV